ncbi:hypothetical protein [Shewanella ulleungensis]|uniref:hypothetical protein n=1 Tax=Shewanella ulleungensis TaxID=2282699 RepID=UPI003D793CF6
MFFVSQYIYHFHYQFNYLESSIGSLLLAFVSVYFVVLFSIFLSKINVKFIHYLGGVSMAIYLMHILAGSGVRVILQKIFNVESVILHTIFGLLAGLLLPIVAVWVMRKMNLKYFFSAPVSRLFNTSINVKA